MPIFNEDLKARLSQAVGYPQKNGPESYFGGTRPLDQQTDTTVQQVPTSEIVPTEEQALEQGKKETDAKRAKRRR